MTATSEKLVLNLFFSLKSSITVLEPILSFHGLSSSGFEGKSFKFKDWGIQIVSDVTVL